MIDPRDELIEVLLSAKDLLGRPGNDFSWSSWESASQALAELDELITAVREGDFPQLTLEVLFAPTGPIQEVSISSGWSQQFIELANKFDASIERLAGQRRG